MTFAQSPRILRKMAGQHVEAGELVGLHPCERIFHLLQLGVQSLLVQHNARNVISASRKRSSNGLPGLVSMVVGTSGTRP